MVLAIFRLSKASVEENELLLSGFPNQSQRTIRKERKQFFVGDELHIAPGMWRRERVHSWIGRGNSPCGSFDRAANEDTRYQQ